VTLPNASSACLLRDRTTVSGDGASEPRVVPEGRLLLITLGVLSRLDQQSLDVMLFGSSCGDVWSPKPVLAFPQRLHGGLSACVLDRDRHPEFRWLRVQWKANRWGRGAAQPRFEIWLTCQGLIL
jgi:hypothetical protein